MTTGAGSGVPGPVAAAATVDAPPRPVTVAGRRSPWGRLGLHLTLAVIAIIWLLPTVSLFVSSFRPEAAVNTSVATEPGHRAPSGRRVCQGACSVAIVGSISSPFSR